MQGIVKTPKGKNAIGTPAGDMSLVFAYMKMLDPASTVREGEQAQARDAAGVPDRVLNAYNQAVKGTTLNTKQRNDFLAQANKIFSQQQARQAKLNEKFSTIAQRNGVNPENIITGTEVVKEVKKALSPQQKEIYEKIKGDPVKLKKFKEKARDAGYEI